MDGGKFPVLALPTVVALGVLAEGVLEKTEGVRGGCDLWGVKGVLEGDSTASPGPGCDVCVREREAK